MKKLFAAAALVLCTGLVWGQQDQKARSILEQVTEHTRACASMQAAFSYVMENSDEGIREVNRGNILIKGDKYHLKLTQLGMETFCDGENVWTYMEDVNEVNISSLEDEAANMLNPSKLFTIYEEGFRYRYVGEHKEQGVPVFEIDLIPESGEGDFSRIRLQVEQERKLVKRAEMEGKDGNTYVVEVHDLKVDVPAENRQFVFDPAQHPGVELVDLR
ncbi:MAG: outer membrane lipoprotein carrier protein LolA [Mangrovibacterium sp.]